jgi:ADP-heptose:LPS heptosyltransferase
MSRGPTRLRALAGAIRNAIAKRRRATRPDSPRKILVLHELLLGDTLMLAPLLAALRTKYPSSEIFVTASPSYAGLFSGRPYGARALPFTERAPDAIQALEPARDCDLALLPGENRHALLARALGAKWIVGFAGGKPGWPNRLIDESIEFPPAPAGLGDAFANLSGLDEARLDLLRFQKDDWPAPEMTAYDFPTGRYAVLHVGAGSPLRLWRPENWREVAGSLASQGLQVIWTAGPNEMRIVEEIDPQSRHRSLAGQLDLAQLWHLLENARLAVTLDTGIAHLAKVTGTPVAVLFGQGSPKLFGRGRFWANAPLLEVSRADFPCRDQRHVFKRDVHWVRRCNRTLAECPRARCMEAIRPEQVVAALQLE